MKKSLLLFVFIFPLLVFSQECADYTPIKINEAVITYIDANLKAFTIADTSNFVDSWCDYYDDNQVPYYQEGDFNGDSITDYAVMIYSENMFRVIMLHNEGLNKFSHHIVLEESSEVQNYKAIKIELDIGLGISPPDEYFNLKTETFFTVTTNSLDIYRLDEPIELYYWKDNQYVLYSYDDIKY
jgi:hypothetical protein